MTKLKTFYVCQECSHSLSHWAGQCPNCGQWNTFSQEVQTVTTKGLGATSAPAMIATPTRRLSEVSATPPKRLTTGIGEFDRVLGGGFVPGQVILLGGEPGVGKSTLLTEISKALGIKKILYVCGEESMDQIKLRTSRMDYNAENLFMLPQTDVESIAATIQTGGDFSLVIIDSIQTLVHQETPGVSGSMTQVRNCAQILTNVAKQVAVPIVLIGHVTKEGVVAGPKVLEHMVDTVLYLEGDTQHMYRILKTAKNRFGPVSEVGIFEMTEKSMKQVVNPSELFLSEKDNSASGSCVTIIMEGQRALLFEVQALTVKTNFGYPRRTASGFNANRLQVLLAILEKRCRLNLDAYDVYVSVAGGFKINEYAADLAVCAAIASSVKELPVASNTALIGECGLSGEIRRVSHQDRRISEAHKMGYTNVLSSINFKTLKQVIDSLF